MPRRLFSSRRNQRQTVAAVALVLAAIALAAWQAARWAGQVALAEARAEVAADAGLRAALIGAEIDRFRLLPMALAADRDVAAALSHAPGAALRLDQRLAAIAAETGAADLYLLAPDGLTIASSNYRAPSSFVGQSYAFRNYYRAARRTGEGVQFALGTASHSPGLYVAHRTVGGGIIVVKRDFLRIEQAWAQSGGMTLVCDGNGIVLVASPQVLRFRALQPLSAARRARFREELQSGAGSLAPLGLNGAALVGWGGRDWVQASVPAGAYGWQVLRLVPVGGRIARAESIAAALTALAGLLLTVIAASLWWGRQRNARLAREVRARTAELRREMAERAASEEHAGRLREELRQANRLATLGQVTAGIAHETAQPIAAIRAYAENGVAFLARGDAATARDNFTAIGGLTERLGTITAQLRSFARRAEDAAQAVSLADAIDGALLILGPRLKGIACTADLGAVPPVRAAPVRLEQVLVNLLQNAAEALGETPQPAIRMTAAIDTTHVTLTIADNGPGIDPAVAERLFTPFATSRANGLGLGLVIARDIMRELGGDLQWQPGPGGAVFAVTLVRA